MGALGVASNRRWVLNILGKIALVMHLELESGIATAGAVTILFSTKQRLSHRFIFFVSIYKKLFVQEK
jgi:hypothetical protein